MEAAAAEGLPTSPVGRPSIIPRASVRNSKFSSGDRVPTGITEAGGKELTFHEFLEVIVHLRPGTSASVLDIADLRKFMRRHIRNLDYKLEMLAGEGAFNSPGQPTTNNYEIVSQLDRIAAKLDALEKKIGGV